jgi:ribonuclease D
VLAAELGVETKKKAKFQKYNWLRRPIDPEALEYALGDVLHLPELKDHLFERLYREHMLEEFYRRNLLVQNRDYRRTPGQRHKKLKGYRYLKKREKELLRRLFNLRDRHARRLDLPPHNVIANPDLLQLSRRAVRPDRLNFARRMKPQDREQILSEVEAELQRRDE